MLIGKGCFVRPREGGAYGCYCVMPRIWSLGALRETPSMAFFLSGSHPLPAFPAESPKRAISLSPPPHWYGSRISIRTLTRPSDLCGMIDFCGSTKDSMFFHSWRRYGCTSATASNKNIVDTPNGISITAFYLIPLKSDVNVSPVDNILYLLFELMGQEMRDII